MSAAPVVWWREPLVWFLGVGALLFAVDLALNPPPANDDTPPPIAVSPEVEEALARAWDEKKGRPLHPDERLAVLTNWVRNEALVREATRLGLDRGDAIIRRRLVQKMEFLVDGQVEVIDPEPAALEAWFAAHADDYVEPASTGLRHHFFSRSRRGEDAHPDAVEAHAALRGAGPDAPFAADPFAGPRALTAASRSRLNRDFGGDFAVEVQALEAGVWSGPVRSSYGWHVLFVTAQNPPRAAAFDDVRATVLSDWRDSERVRQREVVMAEIVARHTAPAP